MQGLLPRRPPEERLAAHDRTQKDFRHHVNVQRRIFRVKVAFIAKRSFRDVQLRKMFVNRVCFEEVSVINW